jgi:stress response protein SCP2
MNNKLELIGHLKEIKFFETMFKDIECNHISKIFYRAVNNLTLNQLLSYEESKQRRVIISARISHAISEWILFDGVEFLKKNSIKVKLKSTRETSKDSFDVTFLYKGEEFSFEIKSSQTNSKWQGSTHSSSKVDDYILINFDIDMDVLVSENNKHLFKDGWFCSFLEIGHDGFKGVAAGNNSRTTFSIEVKKYPTSLLKDLIIIGTVSPKQKYYKIIKEYAS